MPYFLLCNGRDHFCLIVMNLHESELLIAKLFIKYINKYLLQDSGTNRVAQTETIMSKLFGIISNQVISEPNIMGHPYSLYPVVICMSMFGPSSFVCMFLLARI